MSLVKLIFYMITDDLDHSKQGKRKKIEIKFIHERSKRHITFSKRKSGIMKKAYELSVLTGTEVGTMSATDNNCPVSLLSNGSLQ